MSGCHFDPRQIPTLRHPDLLDEATWSRLASGRRRPLAGARAAAARWLRAAAVWLDEAPAAAPAS